MLEKSYDFVVCGAGTSGCVVARRLAERSSASVLLIEAGGLAEHPDVLDASRWRSNLGTERDWFFHTVSNPRLHDRVVELSAGRLLGGGSSINAMGWAHGHRHDWEYFAEVSGEDSWRPAEITARFRHLEHWRGPEAGIERGREGLVSVYPPPDSPSVAPMLDAARQLGLPAFATLNSALLQSPVGGAARSEVRAHDGRRLLIYDDYAGPYATNGRLTVFTHAPVRRVLIENGRAIGVELLEDGRLRRVAASCEVILSLGAINTPRVLIQSGLGAEDELAHLDIPVVGLLPGVGENLQDHVLTYGFVWEREGPRREEEEMQNVWVFNRSRPDLPSPDHICLQFDAARMPPDLRDKVTFRNPFSLVPAIVQPKSRGHVTLRSTDPDVPPAVDLNYFEHPDDLRTLTAAVEFAFDLAATPALRSILSEEKVYARFGGPSLTDFIRRTASTFWHPCGTAAMGRDAMAVVDGQLRVHGVERLRVADASIMPRITTTLPMAPCVIIGEQASAFVLRDRAQP